MKAFSLKFYRFHIFEVFKINQTMTCHVSIKYSKVNSKFLKSLFILIRFKSTFGLSKLLQSHGRRQILHDIFLDIFPNKETYIKNVHFREIFWSLSESPTMLSMLKYACCMLSIKLSEPFWYSPRLYGGERNPEVDKIMWKYQKCVQSGIDLTIHHRNYLVRPPFRESFGI